MEWVTDLIHHILFIPTFLSFLSLLYISSSVFLSHSAGTLMTLITWTIISCGLLNKSFRSSIEIELRLAVDSVWILNSLDGGQDGVSRRWHHVASIWWYVHATVVTVRVVVVAWVIGVSVTNWNSYWHFLVFICFYLLC